MHTKEVVQQVVALQEHASKSAIFLWFTHKNFETQEVKNLYRTSYKNYHKPQEGTKSCL